MRTAEVIAHGRDNNFNLLRMVAASAVIISHSFPLSLGTGTPEPLSSITPLDLGKIAVRVFFVVSGFFVMKSFDRKNSLAAFAAARIGRIIPGLVVVSLLTGWMVGLFAANPYPDIVNGPLWTLWFEAVCYCALALAGLCGLFRNGRFPAILIGFAMFYAAVCTRFLPIDPSYASLGLPFVLGASAYHFRGSLPLGGGISIALFALAFVFSHDATWTLAFGYAALWLGSVNSPALKSYNRLGDYSYGTYIYGWPVQQLLALSVPGIGPWAMMAIALPTAWSLGILSWYLIEHPAMRLIQLPRYQAGAVVLK